MRNADLLKAAVVCTVLSTLGASITSAQTFQTFEFNGTNGAFPFVTHLVQAMDGNLYGGISNSQKSASFIFQLTPAGTLNTLYTFCSTCGADPTGLVQGSDGNL